MQNLDFEEMLRDACPDDLDDFGKILLHIQIQGHNPNCLTIKACVQYPLPDFQSQDHTFDWVEGYGGTLHNHG
jgi:hypothetical protein